MSLLHFFEGERNNSFCCSSYGVPDICVGMCSGKPPVFDNTLAFCITSLSIIEGCIEEGLGKFILCYVQLEKLFLLNKIIIMIIEHLFKRISLTVHQSSCRFTLIYMIIKTDMKFTMI